MPAMRSPRLHSRSVATAEELFFRGALYGWVRESTGSTLNTAVMHVLVDASLLLLACLLILR